MVCSIDEGIGNPFSIRYSTYISTIWRVLFGEFNMLVYSEYSNTDRCMNKVILVDGVLDDYSVTLRDLF